LPWLLHVGQNGTLPCQDVDVEGNPALQPPDTEPPLAIADDAGDATGDVDDNPRTPVARAIVLEHSSDAVAAAGESLASSIAA
jgi:hypothetical protein